MPEEIDLSFTLHEVRN